MDPFAAALILAAACAILGFIIGNGKGTPAAGLLWGLLLGPLGVLIVICLPNPIREKAEEERVQREIALLQTAQDQLAQLRDIRTYLAAPKAKTATAYQLARNGEELGEMTAEQVKAGLAAGSLTLRDHFFDPVSNGWMPLNCLPDLA